jgi:hypothetical protein
MEGQTSTCIVIFLALLIASMVMQWVRARARKKLVLLANPVLLASGDQDKWHSIDKSFDFMFKDFRKLQIAKRNLFKFPQDFQSSYQRYRIISRLEISITSIMLIFGATAFLFCTRF